MNKIILTALISILSPFVNAQSSPDITVEVSEVQVGASVIIQVKRGCNFTGWVSDDKEHSNTFFVYCGNLSKSLTVKNLGPLNNVAVLTTEQEAPVSVQRSGEYGIDWNKVREAASHTDKSPVAKVE
jgi:hypothetical protein